MSRTDVYLSVASKVVAALEEDDIAPWRRPWVGGFPVNAENGRRYRGVNVFLLTLMAQAKGYSDSRWGTFGAMRRVAIAEAKRQGREIVVKENTRGKATAYEVIDGQEVFFKGGVLKGEKATFVIVWKRVPPSKKDRAELGDEARPYMYLNEYAVFNADQCAGIPPLAKYEHDPIEAAEKIVRDFVPNGPVIQFNNAGGAYYQPGRDLVNCPPLPDFREKAGFYSTLYHELVHSTGHKSRLDRLERTGFGSGPYAKEELVAEMGAAMLCGIAGIDNLDQSAAYVKNWLQPLREDPKFVVQAASFAQRASDLILGVTFDKKETEDEAETDEPQLVAA